MKLFQSCNRETFDSNGIPVMKFAICESVTFQSRNRETFDSNFL